MPKLVAFDMDGVLADIESSWVYVHRRFGVNNDHSLHAYLRGEIDDEEFIRRDIALWKEKDSEVTGDSIRTILEDAPLMQGAAHTMVTLKNAGYRTVIISAGIDLLAQRIAQELNMDLYYANGLAQDESGRLSGEGLLRVRLMDKGKAVAEAASRLGVDRGNIVSVGNSKYDVPMFEQSSLGIAFCPADELVRARADIVVNKSDLTEILQHLS